MRNRLPRSFAGADFLCLLLVLVLVLNGCGAKKEEILIAPDGEEHPVETIEGGEENTEEGGAAVVPVLYAVLPSGRGPSATEREILKAAAEEAGARFTALSYAGDPIAMANARYAVAQICERTIGTNLEHAAQNEMRRILADVRAFKESQAAAGRTASDGGAA